MLQEGRAHICFIVVLSICLFIHLLIFLVSWLIHSSVTAFESGLEAEKKLIKDGDDDDKIK